MFAALMRASTRQWPFLPKDIPKNHSMEDLIQRTADDQIDWSATRRRLTAHLVSIGRLYGDPAALMITKANVVTQILKLILDETPESEPAYSTPGALADRNQQWALTTLTLAHQAGANFTRQRVLAVLTSVIDDLCTSKLAYFASGDDPVTSNPTSPNEPE